MTGFTPLAPEALVFTTSHPLFGFDDVLIQRNPLDPAAPVFIQIDEFEGGTASAFLTLNEAIALNAQLTSMILDSQELA